MSEWIYYFSGLRYGEFVCEQNAVQYRWLDETTGKLGDFAPLCAETSAALKCWTSIDPLLELGRLAEYEAVLASAPDTAQTSFAHYTRRADGAYAQRNTVLPVDVVMQGDALAAFVAPSRSNVGVLVRKGCEQQSILAQWGALCDAPAYPIQPLKTQLVPMRDGVRLATDVYLPVGAGKTLPTVFIRTPYGKTGGRHLYNPFVQRGYALVIQDTRGREDSEGEFIPNYTETEDGDDSLNWIAAQSFSNGKVGMIGGSYLGYVQWAAGASGNPHLAAMVSQVTAGSAFADIPRRGGCFVSGVLPWAFAMSERQMRPDLMAQENWDELQNIRPLQSLAQKALGHDIPFLSEWFNHPDGDAFWQKSDWQANWKGGEIPALIVSGWFDDDGMGTTQALDLTANYPAGKRKIVLGGWNHSANTRYDIGDIPVGRNALRYDLDLLYLRWFDRFLKEMPNGIDQTPTLEYFTLGEDAWKISTSWPPACTTPYTLYLGGEDAAGNADTGTLLPAPGQNSSTSYWYDPANPATHIVDMSENELEVPADYTAEEQRPDIACFTTPVLAQDITLTGDALVTLFVSSSAVDTDFVVRVTTVDEEGRSIKLGDGLLDAKYRNGFDAPELMAQGEVYRVCIRTTKFSHRFAKGTRLRVTVTSSAKNFTLPNTNTADSYNGTEIVVAKNTLHCGVDTPSCITFSLEQ